MKENKFQTQVKKQLENQGAFVINLHGHMMQRSGLPDLFILHMKWDGFLELKVEENKASILQRTVAAKIELRGTPIYVLRCVELDEYGWGKFDKWYDKRTKYILENFQNEIIKEFYDLKELLSHLVELNKTKGI